MLLTLLSHQWKSFWRSRNAGKNLAVQIFMGFISLYLLLSALAIGFFLQKLIKELYPGQDISTVFCGFILYYFSFDILVRFLMQDLPTLSIQPYLIQNIRRSQLIRFLNVRSLFTILNLVPILLFVPFTLTNIAPVHGTLAATGFIISILALIVFNHFIVLFIKRKSIISSWWYVGFFLVIAAFITTDYFNLFSLSKLSASVFSRMLIHSWLAIIPLLMAVLAFINNYRFLLNNLFLEDIVAKGKKRVSSDYSFLNRFGTIGELIGVEIRLILRNKRPRSIVLMTVVFLFYGLIFYKQVYFEKEMFGMLLFGAIFITGLSISNYGQFLFAWQSSHFDGLMAGNLNIKAYIKSKFLLFTSVCTVVLLITSFYGLIDWRILLIQLAAYFYNVGIHTVLAIYLATYSYKGIDIGKKAAFNFQGIGAAQWIYSLIVFLIPILIYLPFSLLLNPWAGIVALGIIGLVSLLLQDWWVDLLSKEFMKRKHRILEGFREK